ncbi:hypothetical protein ACB092_01G070400 [Castanea dentata]
MIIISWNCRELGNQRAVDVLTNLVRSKGPNVLFLMETKWSISEMRKLCYDLNFQSVLAVLCDDQSGGLGLFWKAECDLHIQMFSPNHIDTHILSADKSTWRASLPWVCLGDYNEILHSEEKQGGTSKPLAPMLTFKETLLHCGLEDLGYHRYPFTWRNGRPGEAFIERHFPSAKVSHLQVAYSDHDPILLDTQCCAQHARARCKRLYRFKEQWAAHQGCEEVIREVWNYHLSKGSPIIRLEHTSCTQGLVHHWVQNQPSID